MGVRRQPRRDPNFVPGWGGSIDGTNVVRIGNKTVKYVARRGSPAARKAGAQVSHPSRPGYVICYFFLGILTLIACPGSLALALKAIAGMA